MVDLWTLATVALFCFFCGFFCCAFLILLGKRPPYTLLHKLANGSYTTLCQSPIMFETKELCIAVVYCAKRQDAITVLSSCPLPMEFSILHGKAIVG